MKPEATQLASLSALISQDLSSIERLNAELSEVSPSLNSPKPAFRDMAAAAYLLHNIYCALEDAFEQVSRTFENHVVDPAQWHKELLGKMFLEIPTVRPAVLPLDLRGFLNDLRGFRHLFRHSYDFDLNAEKLISLVRAWTAARPLLLEALSRFRDDLLRKIQSTESI
ncbi:MAG: hypothetical protein HYU27_02170 [Acidobacteria bacterium]|nr:hypothetical protein [Acidobacteriota bacterium]